MSWSQIDDQVIYIIITDIFENQIPTNLVYINVYKECLIYNNILGNQI